MTYLAEGIVCLRGATWQRPPPSFLIKESVNKEKCYSSGCKMQIMPRAEREIDSADETAWKLTAACNVETRLIAEPRVSQIKFIAVQILSN